MITQAGKPVTASTIKMTAGDLATRLRDAAQEGLNFQLQLQTWPAADLIELGLTQAEIDAIKGFYVGDLPAIADGITASTWIKQLLGLGI